MRKGSKMYNFFRFFIVLFSFCPFVMAGEQTPSKYSSTVSITIRAFTTFDSSAVKNFAAVLYDSSGIRIDSLVAVDTNLVRFSNVPITGVHSSSGSPTGYFLGQNYPNPFNPSSRIKFTVPQAGPVSFKTYTILGQEDASLEMTLEPGNYEVQYNPGGAAGVIFYRLITKDFTETKKMIQFGGEKSGRSSLTLVSSGLPSRSQQFRTVAEIQANSFMVKLYNLPTTSFPIKDTTIQISGLKRDTTVIVYVMEDQTTTRGSVVIDTNEIGGSGLKIMSCYGGNDFSSNDTSSVRVSTEGNQLLIATDDSNKVRAFTLSTPHNSQAEIMKLDANGTATSLIFMTPGISTTDSTEFDSTVIKINSLSNFSIFREYLKQRLVNSSLNQIVQDSMYDSLLIFCVEEYIDKYSTNFRLRRFYNVQEIRNYFEVIKTDADGKTTLDLANYSWRYVNVLRRDSNEATSQIEINRLLDKMGGGVPYSWGSLITGSALDPARESVEYTLGSQVASSELWVVGPGWKPSSIPPPADIDTIAKPWGESLVNYVLFPVIDLITGGAKFIKTPPPKVKEYLTLISAAKPGISFFKLGNAKNGKEAAREGANLVISLAAGSIAAGIFVGSTATIVGEVLGVSSAVFAAANLTCWVIDISFDEPYTRFELYKKAPGSPCAGTSTVPYAGKTYNTLQIGTQCWLKENLDVGTRINGSSTQTDNGTIEKYCYNDDTTYCNTYGGLYQWNEAMQYSTTAGTRGICPPGWHIPTLAELQTLSTTVGGDGNALKAVGQGTGGGAGTNTSGFSALLAGYRYNYGYFDNLGLTTYFWSSTEYNATDAHYLFLVDFNGLTYLTNYYKAYGFSVRCLED